MSLQMLSEEQARLNFPRPASPPRRIAPARPSAEGSAAISPGGRAWLARLTSGSLGPPDHHRFRDPVLTLVHRISMGFQHSEYERAKTLGFRAYLEEQLHPDSIDDAGVDHKLTYFPVVPLSPKQVFDGYAGRTDEAYLELKSAVIVRAVDSTRQLHERMCEFWFDHFNIDHNKGIEWALLPEFERTVIRPHALGSFPEMLRASAFSGAMLYYLDNWLNVRGAPQENYSRELLELHTLGVDGGYNETDVDEVAKCFTGWTLNDDPSSPDWLRGTFVRSQHTPGQKFVLGHVIGGAGRAARPGHPEIRDDAQAVLDILAAHPSTARFLALKLISRFLTPTPSDALVERVANTYLATSGDIKAMLRVILTEQNLASGGGPLAPKYRRPFHLLTSIMRGMDGNARRRQEVGLGHLAAMGHSPYDFAPPTGYPDDFVSWGGALLPRWIFSTTLLVYNPSTITNLDLPSLFALRVKLDWHGEADEAGLAQRINERILGQTLSPFEVQTLQDFIDGYPVSFGHNAIFDTLTLATSLPGFQWY